MQSAAYDFSAFEPRETRAPRTPDLRVAPRQRKSLKERLHIRVMPYLIALTVILALICGVLYARITATELTAQIASQTQDLNELKSEYDYLENELEMQTNLKTVEQVATGQLGLVKADSSQIVYVERGSNDGIVLMENPAKRVLDMLHTSAMSIVEYMDS